MSERYLQVQICELKILERQKEAIEKKIKERQNVLKSYMVANGLEEIIGENGEKVYYKEVISSRFDLKSFREHYEFLYESFLKNTRNLRFKFSY